MDLNYFKDILFDLLNESDALEPYMQDILCDDRNDTMTVVMNDAEAFELCIRRRPR